MRSAVVTQALGLVLVPTLTLGCFHQPGRPHQLPAEWTTVPADSSALIALVDRTRREGGPETTGASLGVGMPITPSRGGTATDGPSGPGNGCASARRSGGDEPRPATPFGSATAAPVRS